MKIRRNQHKRIASNKKINNFIKNAAKNHQRNNSDVNGIISIGSGLMMNHTATNLANFTTDDNRTWNDQEQRHTTYGKRFHGENPLST